MELQKLFVSLALKADEYKQGLQDAGNQAEGLRSRLGGIFGKVAGIGTAAFLGVGAAAVGGFAIAGAASISMNAQLEQSTMMFTTLIGDADLAQQHVANLFDFAGSTPFETGPIIEASKHLQIFGGDALNSMENLTLVGDAAAAVGAPIDEVGFWVGRLYSNLMAGQPFGEAAMRLQELGIMAPETRTKLEEMQKAGADGTVVWGEYQGALGGFTGAMDLQAGSWVGLTSTIKDQLGLLMAEGLRPFFDLVKEGLAGLAEWLSSPEVQAAITTFATNLGLLVTGLIEFVTTVVVPFVQTHGPELKAVLIALAAAFAGLLIVGAVGAAIALLTNPITWIVAAVGALAAAWATNFMGIRTITESVVNFIRPFIENALAAIRAFWDQHGAAIMAAAKSAWEFIQTFIKTAIALIQATALAGLKIVQDFWDAHGEKIMNAAKTAWEFIDRLIEGILEHVKLVFDAWRALFEGDWDTLREKLIEIWQNLWDTVLDILSGLWDLVHPWLLSLWNNIKAFFTDTDWASLGQAIIDGIIAGIQAAAHALFDIVRNLAADALNVIKEALGIASPAKATIPIGQAIVEGISLGIQEEEDNLFDVVARMIGGINNLLEGGGKVGGIAGGMANHFKRLVIGPIESQMEALEEEFGKQRGWYERGLQFFMPNAEALEFGDPRLLSQLRLMRDIATDRGYGSQLGPIDRLISMAEMRNGLEEEYIRQQEKLLALDKARADLDFLKQQMDMLNLMRQHGIPMSALGGVELGLTADPAQLMGIMVDAMERIVRATQAELNSMNQSPAVTGRTPGTDRTTTNIQTQNINGGQHLYFYDSEESQLEIMEILSR